MPGNGMIISRRKSCSGCVCSVLKQSVDGGTGVKTLRLRGKLTLGRRVSVVGTIAETPSPLANRRVGRAHVEPPRG